MFVACKPSCRSRPRAPARPSCFSGPLAETARGAVLIGFAVLALPHAAHAQPAVAFDIPAQPLAEGVLAVGRQAGVSVGVRDSVNCAPVTRAVRGRLTVERALTRLLAGSGCGFRRVDAQSYVVAYREPAPAGGPAPAVPVLGPATPDLLGSLVVSAARRDALVGRTPYAISVLSGAALRDGAINGSQEVASQFAGLVETNLGAGRDKLFIRGISDGAFTGRTQSTVGLYLDDVPITYSAPNPDLFLADVERVEVLRGPQGTLYGVGSMGGLLRIVTRRPDAEAFHASASAILSSTAEGHPSSTVTGMVNLPLVHDRIAIRAVGYDEVMGGYLDNRGLGLSDVNRSLRRGFRVAASAVISPEWRLNAGYTLQALDARDGQSALDGAGLERGRALQEPHDNDFHQASATLEGRGDWGGLKVSVGYVRHDFDTRYDATPAAGLFHLSPSAPTAYDELNQVEFTVAETVLTSPEGRRLQGLVGAFVAHAEQGSIYSVTQDAAPPGYLETRKDAVHEAALFGEVSYAITGRLKLTAGARVFGASLRTATTNVAAAGEPLGGRLKKADVAPKVVLGFQATRGLLVYAQAAEGYRLGGFNTSGLPGQVFSAPGGAQPGLSYGADELWSYEVGAKAALLHSRLQLQAAAFYAVWRDVQSDQFLANGLPYTANVGKADNRGLEVEASLRLARRLTLKINALVNSPEVIRVDPTFAGRSDAGLPAVPKVSTMAMLDYRHRLGGGLTFGAQGQMEYVGRSRLGFGPVAGPSMGGYLTNRVSVQISSARWRVQLFAENLTDAREDTFAFGNPFSAADYTTPMRPRTVGVSIAAEL